MDIKETMDVLNEVSAVLECVKVAKSDDGKITFSDFPAFTPAALGAPEAIMGSSQIGAELKELDSAEIEKLIAKFAEITKKVIDLFK